VSWGNTEFQGHPDLAAAIVGSRPQQIHVGSRGCILRTAVVFGTSADCELDAEDAKQDCIAGDGAVLKARGGEE
jgi:hypothetical protein